MANPYPIAISTIDAQEVRIAGLADFTDPDNQPGGGSSPVASVAVPISSAAILTMHDSPVTLVAAQGAGTVIAPVYVVAELLTGSSDYDTNTRFQIIYAGLTASPLVNVPGFLSSDPSAILILPASLGSNSVDLAAVDNAALVAFVASGNPDTGDGTMLVTVLYSVVAL